MILTVTIGNRTVSFAFFEGTATPLSQFCIASTPMRTADEYAALIAAMPQQLPGGARVQTAVIASVVPPLTDTITSAVQRLFPEARCLHVGAGLRTGLSIQTDAPAELGADLVALACGAANLCKPPLLVLNLGEVITLSAVSVQKEQPCFLGCAILPGISVCAGALKQEAALLSATALSQPRHAIGTNTGDSVRAGIMLGHAAAITHLIAEFEQEMDARELPLVVSGDEAPALLPLLHHPPIYEAALAHKGLYHMALLNAKKEKNAPKRV